MSAQASDQIKITSTLVAGALQLSIAFGYLVMGLAYSGFLADTANELSIQRVEVPVGAWFLALALATAVPAAATLRTVHLWAWRLSVGVLAASVITSATQRQWPLLILSLLVLWLLLARPLRTAAHRTPHDAELAQLEDRAIRRAKRRLTPDEPTLDGVSFGGWKPPGRRDEAE